MGRLFWICLGGAVGTAARYAVGVWAAQRWGSGFPYGILIVNLVGCFAIAIVMSLAAKLGWPPTLRVALTVGVLGGFTTYSSFNYETMRLLQEGAAAAAGANLILTTMGGFLAGWLGLVVAHRLIGG